MARVIRQRSLRKVSRSKGVTITMPRNVASHLGRSLAKGQSMGYALHKRRGRS